MPRFSFFGLRARLLLLVLLAIIPALGLMLYNAAEARRQAMLRAEADALQVAQQAAGTHAQYIEQAHQILTRLTQLPSVRRGPQTRCREIFNDLETQYLQQYPRYTNLGVISPDGEVSCSVLPITGPASLAQQPAFQAALQTLDLSLGNYEIDRAIGKTTVTLFQPVVDFEGQQALVMIFATLDMDWLNQLAAQADLPQGSTFTVVDPAGKILIRYPDGYRWVGETMPEVSVFEAMHATEGTLEAWDAEGTQRLYAFAPLEKTSPAPAYLSIGLPAAIVFAEADRLLSRNLLTLGAATLLALAAAWAGGDLFVLQQVRALVEATRRLSAGDLSARTGLPARRDELSQLAHTFDRMAEALERRETERQQAETALRKSEELYRTLAENFPNGAVILFDRDLRYTLADGAGLGEVGLSKDMLEGRTIQEIFPPEVTALIEPYYRAALAGTEGVFEMPFAARVYRVHTLPLRNERGEIFGGLAMTQDITGQVQAQQLLEQRVEERTRELASLLQIAHDMASTLALEPLLGQILDQLKAIVDYSGASVLTLEGEVLVIRTTRGPIALEAAGHLQFPVNNALDHEIIVGRQVVIISDVHGEAAMAQAFREAVGGHLQSAYAHVRSWMGVPLIVQDQAIGMLALHQHEPDYFSKQHAELAAAFATQVAVAVKNARLFETEQRRAEQFRVIGEVGRRITSILDIDELLNQTARSVREAFGYYHVHIGLVEGDEIVFRTLGAGPADDPQFAHCESMRLKIGQEGLVGWVAAHGESLLVPDVSRDRRFVAARKDPTRAELVVPIKVKGLVIGVLEAESDRVNAFDDSDCLVLQFLADQAAVAIENARLYASERRRAEQFRVISEVGHRITSILTVDDLLFQTEKLIRENFGYYYISIGLVAGDELHVKTDCACDRPRLKIGVEGVMGWVAASGEALLVPDVSQESRYLSTISSMHTRSELALPIKVKGQIIGVLNVESEQLNAFDHSDVAVLQSLANQLAVALENARLYEQAQQLAALEERQKLARELHDSVSQALYGIALGARTARALLNRDPGRVVEPLDYVLSLSEAALAEMRALIFELRPESLATEGLVAALDKHAASLRARHRLDVHTTFGEEPEMTLELKQTLYRIAQEAMHNTIKHARAGRMDLLLQENDGEVMLEMSDNGVGFDTAGSFPGHLGLQSMRERAERLGASLEVESAPGQGTRVRVRVHK